MNGGADETLLRDLAPTVLGVLVRRGADFATAEDAVQEALLSAAPGKNGEPVYEWLEVRPFLTEPPTVSE